MRPIFTCLLAALWAAPLTAQSSAVTRRDLADAYLQVDRTAMTVGVPADRRADWNRQFDRSTLAFFGGDFPRVLREMHTLLAQMVGDDAPGSATRQLLALRLDPAQRTLVAGRDTHLEIGATVMYADSSLSAERTLGIRVLDESGTAALTGTLTIPANAAAGSVFTVRLSAAPILQRVGRYRIDATLAGAKLPSTATVFVLPDPIDTIRARLEQRLATLAADANAQDVSAVRGRLPLLTDRPNPANSAQFLANPAALATQIDAEVRALSTGRNPFELRAGDYWRTLAGATTPIAMRVYAPQPAALGARMPVVIALHGAGADENMFLDGYGAGRLRALADSMEFMLVSPNTNEYMRNAGALDSTLAMLERSYVIDRGNVFVLGHSMGGAATVGLASQRRADIKAAAVIAGAGNIPADGQIAPTLFIGAETDLVIPVTRVRATYDQGVAKGAPLEYRQADGWGHTLVVGAKLDEVLQWLFSR